MHQQLWGGGGGTKLKRNWGYKVEEELHLVVRELEVEYHRTRQCGILAVSEHCEPLRPVQGSVYLIEINEWRDKFVSQWIIGNSPWGLWASAGSLAPKPKLYKECSLANAVLLELCRTAQTDQYGQEPIVHNPPW
jgi:hypothetical protein